MIQSKQAVFTGAEDHVDVTWDDPFTADYFVSSGVVVTDGGGPVAIALTTVTSTGLTVKTSAAFNGHVDLLGYGIIT